MHRLPILLACLCLAFPVLAQDTDDLETDSTDSSSAPSPDCSRGERRCGRIAR